MRSDPPPAVVDRTDEGRAAPRWWTPSAAVLGMFGAGFTASIAWAADAPVTATAMAALSAWFLKHFLWPK